MFGDSTKQSKEDRFEKLYKYVKSKNKIFVMNKCLYSYDDENLYYIKLADREEELLAINKMIQESIRDSVSPKTIENIAKKLKMDPKLQLNKSEFNKDMYVHFKNGILSLYNFKFKDKKNMTVEDKFTYMLNCNYKQEIVDEAQKNLPLNYLPTENYLNVLFKYSKSFKKYVESSLEGNKDKIKFLLQSMAYMCTDLIKSRLAFIYIGETGSGKSLIAKFLIEIIGAENVGSIPINMMGSKFNIGETLKYRVNISSELERKPIKNINVLKGVISGDRVFADKKGMTGIHDSPQIRILQLTNYLPNTVETDDSAAFKDRLAVLLFNKSIPVEERDKNLLEKLLQERDCILTIAFSFLREVIENNFVFKMPKESEEFLKNYGKSVIKEVESFIQNKCEVKEDFKEFTVTLYNEYKSFCEENFIDCCTRTDFLYAMDKLGYKRSRFRKDGKNCRGYIGIRLREEI